MDPICAIKTLKELKTDISINNELNTVEKTNMMVGVQNAIISLQRAGFVEVSDKELPTEPVQLELPLNAGN